MNHAETLLKQRYYQPGENWEQLVERNYNYIQKDYPLFLSKQLLLDRVWLPNSPSLVNAGKKDAGLFACFTVGPTEDTLEDSFNTLTDIALVAKRGGGCGFSGSVLRQKDAPVAGSAHGYAYGPNRFAKLVSYATDAMTQSGFRKMALMYTLSCEHPDAEDFIFLKQTESEAECYNFNQSLMATDSWMNRALMHSGSKEEKLLNLIAKHAWSNGDPGLLFETTINENTPYKHTGQYITTTNPCAEEPLPPYGSCNLGCININHKMFNKNGYFDYHLFSFVVREVVKYLDATGMANTFPTEKHRQWYEENRPIGVGLMGVADLFLRYKLRYGNLDSLLFLEKILKTLQETAYDESEYLGNKLGVPKQCEKLPIPRRNITCTTIAPTGSRAMIADCSYSIEPIFSASYIRTDERGEEYLFVHPEAMQDYFVSSVGEKQPTWKEQIDLVSLCQKYIDSGVSKTINLPNNATVEDVKECLIYAWKKGLKGVTVYRDGSRNIQPLVTQEYDPSCPSGVCAI